MSELIDTYSRWLMHRSSLSGAKHGEDYMGSRKHFHRRCEETYRHTDTQTDSHCWEVCINLF